MDKFLMDEDGHLTRNPDYEESQFKYTMKCTQCGAEYESDESMYFCPKC